MKLKKIEDPNKLKVGKKYLYKAWGNWQVGTCETPYGDKTIKALCNFTYASLKATDDFITEIYRLK